MSTYLPSAAPGNPAALPEWLRETLRPEYLRHNPFRVLRLPVTATAREVEKEMQRRQMMAELGGDEASVGGLLELAPPPDAAVLREARQRLQDNARRLGDEFFWFWPLQRGPAVQDAGLLAIARGDIQEANNFWQGKAGPERAAARHNLAVLYLHLALESGHAGEAGTTGPDYWASATARWREVFEAAEVWERMQERVRELEDARVTEAQVEELRHGLPLALLQMHAGLAVAAVERGELARSRAHRKRMNEYGQLESEVTACLEHALKPAQERVETLNAALEERTAGLKAAALPLVAQHLQDTQPLLRLVDSFLPTGNSLRDHLHDEVALSAFSASIAGYNETEKWDEALQFIAQLRQIAATESAQARLTKNGEQAQENISGEREAKTAAQCWFCRTEEGDDDAKREINVHGNVVVTPTGNGSRTTWNYRAIPIQRCKPCRAKHRWVHFLAFPLGLLLFALALGATAGILVAIGLLGEKIGDWGIALMIVAFIAGLVAIGLIPMVLLETNRFARRTLQPMFGSRHDLDLAGHPLYDAVLAQGWKLGKKP